MQLFTYNGNWIYDTLLPVAQCIASLVDYCSSSTKCELNPMICDCMVESPSQVLLTFRGYHYGKPRKTEYIATFYPVNNTTVVTLQFSSELWGLPPFTSINEVDLFLQKVIHAKRRMS